MRASTCVSCDKNGHAHQPHKVRLTQHMQWLSLATVNPQYHGHVDID